MMMVMTMILITLAQSLDLRGSDRETQDRSERFLHRLALASLPGHVDNCELGTQGIGAPPMPLPRLTELRLEFPPLSLLELLQQSGRLGRFEVLGRSDHVIHPSGVKLRRRAERIAAAAAMDQPPQPTETAASRQDQILEALWDARRLRNGSVELRPEFTRRLLDRLRRGDEAAEAGFRWENLVLAVDQPGPRGLEILAHFPHLRQLSLLPDVGDDEALLVSTTTTTTTPRSDNDNEAPTGNESFGASFEALTGLRELFVSQPEAVFTGHQRLTAAAWSSILSMLPNLTSLVVLDRCRHSLLSALGSAGLSSLTSLKLRGLRLGHHGSDDDALPLSRALWESLEALPSLRQVDLGVDTQLWTHAPVDDNGRDDSGGAVEHLVRHTGLEAFRMYGPGDTRLRLTCPQLRSCHLNFYPLRDLLGLVDDLVAHSPLLEDLQVNGIDASTPQSSRSDDGAWLGRLLVGLPRLRLLSLTGRTPRSDAGAVASLLGGTSLLLGELDLDCVIDTASLDVVLAACPRLHTLHLAAYRDPAHETAADEAADGPSPDLLLPRTTLPALRYLALGPLRSGQAENNESEDENDRPRRLDLAAVAPHVQKVVLHQVHATKVVVSAGCDALCSLSVWQRSRIAVEVAQARRLRKLALAVDDASTLEVADCPALASLNIMANGYSARLSITRLDGCPALANVTAYGELMSVDAALAAVRSAHSGGISNT
jgi:hypothetical protein